MLKTGKIDVLRDRHMASIRGKVNGNAGKGMMISPVNKSFAKGKVRTISKK